MCFLPEVAGYALIRWTVMLLAGKSSKLGTVPRAPGDDEVG